MTKKISKTPKTNGTDMKMTAGQERDATFDLRNRHVLGTMDSLTKRMKSSAELLEKRVEFLVLVHEDDTRTLDKFQNVTDEEWEATLASIEAIHMDFAREYVEATAKAIDAINALHTILGKKKNGSPGKLDEMLAKMTN